MSRFIGRIALSLCLLTPMLFGQRTNASLSGSVTDPSKASIPKVTVLATETATGATFKAITDASGAYVMTNLSPGSYELKVQSPGFETYVRRNIVLTVDQAATINVTTQHRQLKRISHCFRRSFPSRYSIAATANRNNACDG